MSTHVEKVDAERLAQAFVDLRAGQQDRARAAFADLKHHETHGVDAHRGLAAIAWQRKEFDTAVQLLRLALQRTPDHADANADLALILLTSGRAEESLAYWDQRLRLVPRDSLGWHNYGAALVAAGHFETAATAFERALQLAPEHARTYESYARMLMSVEQHGRAEDVWRRGLARVPGKESFHLGLAEVLFAGGRTDECLEVYKEALVLLPESPDLSMGLGALLDELGDKSGAEMQFRRALHLRPGWAIAIESLLALLRARANPADLDAARAVLADPSRPPADHANAAYGLGKALESAGDHDGAFVAWTAANTARRRQIGAYDRSALTKRVDRLVAQFSKAFLDARSDWGSASRRPVFVLGMPRSGTTLVEQILAAHPDAYGYGELTEIGSIIRDVPRRAGTMQLWPEAAAALTPALVQQAADEYLERMQKRHATPAARLVDKAPTNSFHIGLLALMFPGARIIWCRRDPRDICLSIYTENFGLTQKHATDLGDIGFFYKEHQRMMRHWSEVARAQIYECRYEELVADFEPQCRRLVEATGLPWDEQCLRFHEAKRAVSTPSRWQVRSPIYSAAIGRWKRYEKFLAPLLAELEGLTDDIRS